MMFRSSRNLDDCVLTLKRGISPRYSEDGVFVINQRCIRDGRVVLENARRHDEKARAIPDDRVVRQWDVLVNSTGVGTLGRVAQFTTEPDGLTTVDSHVTIVRPDLTKLDGRFFGYVMRARESQITLMGEGATGQTELSRLRLGSEVLIPEPPLPLQRAIGRILGSIDDLIENNRRRIEVLEEMAQAIYREWFVHFRFPGHEDATFVESPLGPIPEGWEVSTCGQELEVLGGGTPSKKEPAYWFDAQIPWFTPSDLTRSPSRFAGPPELRINELGLSKSSARLFPAGSVMMTSRATLGVLAIAQSFATTNQGFIVIPPDDRWPPSFIYEWLSQSAPALEAIATGATFKEITKGAFKRFPFMVPSSDALASFRATVEPLDETIKALLSASANLAEQRDLLLPRLVSGEIDVSDLDLDAVSGGVV